MQKNLVPIHIDGGTLEGGGQLVRNAVAFAALLLKPINVSDIRNKRKPGGLKPQHTTDSSHNKYRETTGLKLVEQICDATTEGIQKGSMEITFIPQKLKIGQYIADTATAGSIALLLQITLPCLLFASPHESEQTTSYLTLKGGTNAAAAPQIDYTEHVFLPFLHSQFGIDIHLEVQRRGYWPKGGGDVSVIIPSIPDTIPAINLTTRGPVVSVRGKSFVAGGLPLNIAELMAQFAKSSLVAYGIDKNIIDIEVFKDEEAIGSGSGIVLWAHTAGGCILGGSAVGAKGTNATITGRRAGEELVRNLSNEACVDEYLQDQIIIFMALAKGTSRVSIGPVTTHTKLDSDLVSREADKRNFSIRGGTRNKALHLIL
ncbi:hypothetical protein Clacol_006711 [Clathrus columnatus]|uniref:RNA 3'-terminal phosphate cyclase n=1 Tax=Clathrus columnatus TaxID=1419009 RepID=A0AAV5AH28_9AGAM|nr:hypothetical protein Clacol_006711 [Clathrus columnatus]